jgi:hypothetical protein
VRFGRCVCRFSFSPDDGQAAYVTEGNRLQDYLKAALVLGHPAVVPLTNSYLHVLQVILGFCDVESSVAQRSLSKISSGVAQPF